MDFVLITGEQSGWSSVSACFVLAPSQPQSPPIFPLPQAFPLDYRMQYDLSFTMFIFRGYRPFKMGVASIP